MEWWSGGVVMAAACWGKPSLFRLTSALRAIMGDNVMLLKRTDRGLLCEPGGFYVDPWRPVDMAIITHAHSDHARPGSKLYLAEASGAAILHHRLGPEARVETLAYGESATRNGVKISLHPAGHILGSAQVRLEYGGEVCVFSGDYKVENDGII